MKHPAVIWRSLIFLLSVSVGVCLAAQGGSPPPAVPVEPIAAIIDAFRSHQVVALGEGNHGNEQGHAFRLSLIRDRRFASTVNDIVVETGNALYQDVIDRFIRGEDIDDDILRRVWQNTTQPFTTFDSPIYEELFRAVRSVNLSSPPDRQLRVVLGDPPVDWNRVQRNDRSEWNKWMAQRNSYPVELIQREVLAKRRRALLVYGDMHFQRKDLNFNYVEQDGRANTIVNLLEHSVPSTSIFSIWTNTAGDLQTLQEDVVSWPKPSLAIIRGTTLGAADFTFYYRFEVPRVVNREGTFENIPRDQWRMLRMEDQADAILYVGRPSDITYRDLSPALCTDSVYMKMRLERFALVGLPERAADQLKQFCASVAPK